MRILSIFGLLMCTAWAAKAATELVEIRPRDGVTQKVMLLEPDARARAVLILYVGGSGALGLGSYFGRPTIGDKSLSNNFLARVREKFVGAGYVVAVPDVPSDRKKLDYIYRLGTDQGRDASSLVQVLKARYSVPVWLIGTSTGSLSAANGGIVAGGGIGGIVLTSSITRVPSNFAVYGEFPEGVVSMALPTLKVPALLLAHKDDQCDKTPASDMQKIAARLTASPRVETVLLEGGDQPRSEACEALSPHGFLGVEDDAVARITGFIGG